MKKRILSMLAAFVLIASLAACAGQPGGSDGQTQTAAQSESDGAPSGGPTEGGGRSIVFHAGKMDDRAREVYDEYFIAPLKAAFPDDDIQYEMFVDRQSVQVQVAAGAGPDILNLDGPTDGVEFFKAQRVLALDSYAEQYGWKDLFYEWAYESGFYDGSLISLPNSFEGMVLYCNVAVFEENGWDYPKNLDEIIAIMNDALSKGIMPLSFGNSDYQGAVDWLYSTFMSCYPGPDALKKALEGETRVDEGLVLESIEMMDDWWQKGYFSEKKTMGISTDDLVAMFADNRAAMMINGTWAVFELEGTYTVDWNAEKIPELRSGVGQIVPLATGGVYVVNAASKDPDFAAEVLNQIFVDTDTHFRTVDEAYYQPFPIKAFDLTKMTTWSPSVIDMYGDLISAMEADDVGYCAWTFFPSDMRVYMNENTDNLFLGNLTAKEFMSEAQTYIDKALADGTAPVVP